MKKRVPAIAIMVCVGLGIVVRAQNGAQTGPVAKRPNITAEELLEKNLAAGGGREALEKVTSYYLKAAFEMPGRGIQGTLEVYGRAPNRLLTVKNINKVGVIKQGYDGKVGWSQDPYQGLRVLEGEELEIAGKAAIFNPELKWRELYEKVELMGAEKLGEKEAYVVRLTAKDGSSETRYYEVETYLLLGTDVVYEGQQGKIPIETRYRDYREVDGVKVSFQWTQKSPVGETVITVTEVKNNIEIGDAVFVKPMNAKPD
ncbi:MAG: outer membrane lipoprotein-sorting protein [Acidobacteria bacterium]|nr:outer membrane lipoprotein-sorting protein [Acidobacteriota bacterium]